MRAVDICGIHIRTNYLDAVWRVSREGRADVWAETFTSRPYQFKLNLTLHTSSSNNLISHHITRSIVFALAWSGEVVAAASFSGWRDQSEACLCSVTKSRQTICPGRKIMWKCFFFFCCHSVAFSRELFSRICFDIFVKLEMSKLALCILYMLQQLPIQLHNASK